MSFFDILSAGQERGHTLFRLLCLELFVLSLSNMLRRSIVRRWPTLAWLAEVVATLETGFIFYVEVRSTKEKCKTKFEKIRTSQKAELEFKNKILDKKRF